MATQKQIAANRRNAQRSTGPGTPEGKALVAQNSVTHGLFARQNTIADEDPADFERHRSQLLAVLRPADPMELLLADRIVALAWRLLRTNRMQTETIDYLFPKPTYESIKSTKPPVEVPPKAPLGQIAMKGFVSTQLIDRLLTYENRINRAFYRACLELQKRQAARIRRATSAAALPERIPEPASLPQPVNMQLEKANPILTSA